ncbi:Uncharacterised protein [Dorea longicatena]|nr:Uncharacterised protein [Dorea longicatena]
MFMKVTHLLLRHCVTADSQIILQENLNSVESQSQMMQNGQRMTSNQSHTQVL